MSKKMVKIIAVLISAVFIFGAVASIAAEIVFAEPSVQEKIRQAEQKKKDAQGKLNETKKKKTKSLAEKERLEKEAVTLQAEIDNIDKQLATTEESLVIEEAKLNDATQKAQEKYDIFKDRFRIMCEQGDVSYLEMLFSAKSFADFVDKAEIMQEIAEYDKRVFDNMEEFRVAIEKSRDEIMNLKISQENFKNNLNSRKKDLIAKQQQQKEYIREIEADAATYQRIIDEEDRAMESLKAQISSSLSTSSRGKSYVGGEFTWPTPSCTIITSAFSPRRKNPVTGIYKRHTGTDIGAGYGAEIVAANAGTVTLASWNSGYGNCVIIDHGGGKATLYGHMSSYSVSKGQTVKKGQRIGAVGSTGNSTGPHLHFEILINGQAVDPMQYF